MQLPYNLLFVVSLALSAIAAPGLNITSETVISDMDIVTSAINATDVAIKSVNGTSKVQAANAVANINEIVIELQVVTADVQQQAVILTVDGTKLVLDAATDALSITIAVLDRIRDKAEVLNSLGYGIIAGSKLKAWKQANDDFWAALLKIIASSLKQEANTIIVQYDAYFSLTLTAYNITG